MRRAFDVEEANTYVRLFNYDKDVEKSLRGFSLRKLSRWAKVPGDTFGSHKYEISHVFATFTPDKSEYRISKGFYPQLLNYFKKEGYEVENIKLAKKDTIKPVEVNYKWKNNKEVLPRNEEQQEYIDFILRDDKPINVINMRTGGGKSFVAIRSFVLLGHRVVLTLLPRYTPIWIKEFRNFLNLKPKDIINVSDWDINILAEKLKKGELNPKIIIFQLTRIDTYIKRMREFPESLPHLDNFFEILGGGVRIIDEAHESIYSVYCSMLYGNFKRNIALSATLNGDDDFINTVYNATFPPEAYLKPPVYEKYIHVIGYIHRLNNQRYRINTKGFGGYSHVLYEKGIMRNKIAFENYYKLCKQAFEEYYLNEYREGQKAMWFFATVAFCKKFEERLKKDYPDLDIFTFTGEVSKQKGKSEEYNKHQIIITTPKSCGTGKDIPKLYIVFACVSISSSQMNDQMSGRVRPIDKWWDDIDPIFLYFICQDIPKQWEYHRKRRIGLEKKTKQFSLVDSFIWV